MTELTNNLRKMVASLGNARNRREEGCFLSVYKGADGAVQKPGECHERAGGAESAGRRSGQEGGSIDGN